MMDNKVLISPSVFEEALDTRLAEEIEGSDEDHGLRCIQEVPGRSKSPAFSCYVLYWGHQDASGLRYGSLMIMTDQAPPLSSRVQRRQPGSRNCRTSTDPTSRASSSTS